jgi:hypothetical protein
MGRPAYCRRSVPAQGCPMLAHALLIAAAAMPAALFAAVWIHEGRREAEARTRASAPRRNHR